MRLLFDENLSPKLSEILAVDFPESTHVRNVGMRGVGDAEVWTFAKEQRFVIVSKEHRFSGTQFLGGLSSKDYLA